MIVCYNRFFKNLYFYTINLSSAAKVRKRIDLRNYFKQKVQNFTIFMHI